jgi:UDP-N-acetylglucosamine 2-epimerase (non-hydrolysing)
MDEGTVVMSSLHPERLKEAVHLVTNHFKENPESIRIIGDYNVDNVSKKVVRIIQSYVDYINRTVWHKDTTQRFDVTTTLNDTV